MQLVQNAIAADTEEFTSSYAEENDLLIARKKVEQFLIESDRNMSKQRTPSKDRNKIIFENYSDESDCDVAKPSKRQKTDGVVSSPKTSQIKSTTRVVLQTESFRQEFDSTDKTDVDSDKSSFGWDESSNDSIPELRNEQRKEHTRGKERNSNNIKKTQKKSFTKVKQSRISFATSRTPSPSYYDENELHNFIVDDLKTKNKKITPKHSNLQKTSSAETPCKKTTKNISGNNKTLQSTKRKWRQKSVASFTDVIVNSDSDNEKENRHHDQSYSVNHPIFHIKVRIAEQCFLFPCQNASELTVKGLAEQVCLFHYWFCNFVTRC